MRSEKVREALERLRTARQECIIENDRLVLDLIASCEHDEVVTVSKYVEGGYLDTAYTIHQTICTGCGEVIEEERENHGWYS